MQEFEHNGVLFAKQIDKYVLYILVFLTYLPLNTMYNIVRIFVVGLLFFLRVNNASNAIVRQISKYMVAGIIIPVLSVMLIDHTINFSIVSHEMMRMVYCALILIVVSTLNVKFNWMYRATILAFVPNFCIQFGQYLHISSVTAFIYNHYIAEELLSGFTHLQLADAVGGDFRGGSIYINPNVFMVIPLLSLVVFLQQDYRSPNIINYVLIGSTLVSGYFCGSRTATVVSVFILLLYVLRYAQGKSKTIMILFLIIGSFILARSTLLESRAFQLRTEDMDSLTVKFNGFLWYWHSTRSRILYWVTGSLGAKNVSGIDCEWGHLYSWYGLFGLYWYIKYNILALQWDGDMVFYSKPMTYTCMLCAITASVMLCMPIYSVVVVLLFARIVN